MSMVYRAARWHVGQSPRRRKAYVAYRAAPAYAFLWMGLAAVFFPVGIAVLAGVWRFVYGFTH